MTKFAILRTAKLKTWGNISGSMGHTYRHAGMAPNADPTRLGKNRVLVGAPRSGVEDIRSRIEGLQKKPRANAVLCVEHLMTMSPEWSAGKTEKQIAAWARENIKWLQKRYGKENVVHAVLHNDESTPHIAAYVVPEVGGSLNARALFGGRKLMSEMQTDYAAAMKKFGLQRGLEGSKARHQTVKSFYASLNQVEALGRVELRKIAQPIPYPVPTLKAVISQSHREAERETWEKKDQGSKATLVKTAGRAVTATKTLSGQVRTLKSENSALRAEIDDLKARLTSIYEQLELPKDEISKLRKLDISAVAGRLEYYDEVQRGENAIDLVKRVNGFDYGQAVAWLHDEFGPAPAAAAVRENLEVSPPDRPFTKSEKAIQAAIRTQLDGLGCDRFRLSLIAPDGEGAPYLPGKIGSEERFYDRSDIERMIPYLRYENNVGGRHIFITPMDDHAYYVLLDDLRIQPEELEEKGFKPCLVQRTSWESTQAVLKVPREDVVRDAVVKVFNQMNKEMGDASISGLRHPFRLAGFRNVKPKHQREGKFPFVTVVSAINRFCRKTWDLVKKEQQPAAVNDDLLRTSKRSRSPKM